MVDWLYVALLQHVQNITATTFTFIIDGYGEYSLIKTCLHGHREEYINK